MNMAYEAGTNLAFDTDLMRKSAQEYSEIAKELRQMSGKLNGLLENLKENGWTTKAGSLFHELVNTNWNDNIELYASMLDTLNDILMESADEYDLLVTESIRQTTFKEI